STIIPSQANLRYSLCNCVAGILFCLYYKSFSRRSTVKPKLNHHVTDLAVLNYTSGHAGSTRDIPYFLGLLGDDLAGGVFEVIAMLCRTSSLFSLCLDGFESGQDIGLEPCRLLLMRLKYIQKLPLEAKEG